MQRPSVLLAAMLAAGLAGTAQAARINYQFELTGLHSDNIDLSEDDPITETVLIPRLLFDVKEEGSRVELEARGQLEYRHYLNGEFDDESRGEFAGQLNWALMPNRLHLLVEDYLSEESINFRDGRYPGNLQQVNVFIIGPSYYARLGDANRLQVDLRAADSHAEVSPGFDGKRYSAAASLQRDLTATSTASLNLITLEANFDDPLAAVDYRRNDAFVRYEGSLRNVEYELDLGRTRLDREQANNASSNLVRLTVEWRPNPSNRLRLRARHQFTDEVQDLVIRLRDPDETLIPDLVDPSSSLVTAGVYLQKGGDLDYRYEGGRLGVRVRPLYRRLSYLDRQDADRTESGVFSQVDYRLTPHVDVFFNASVRDREFRNRIQDDKDHVYRLGFEHELSRHWGWRAEALRNERDSNVVDARYTENAVLLTVWWKR